MASWTITIPGNKLTIVLEALTNDYEPVLPNGQPNPLTPTQHAKRRVEGYLQRQVRIYREGQAHIGLPDDGDITVS